MQTESRRRLIRDFKKIQEDSPDGIIASPLEDNIMSWQAVIFGPEDTPWEGGFQKLQQYSQGIFKLTLDFTEDYPNKAPKVKFTTKLFHPNGFFCINYVSQVYQNGDICLDILDNQWSPIFDISAILTSIQSLLCDPNPASPANAEAAKLYQEDRKEYMRRVKEMVELTLNEA